MLSLDLLKRCILFCVVVILIVLVGLISCTTTPEIDDKVIETEIQKEIEISTLEWWGQFGKHSDAALLEKKVFLNKCLKENGKLKNKKYQYLKIGAWIHHIRIKKWDDTPFSRSVALSIVPYIETRTGEKHIIFPKIENNVTGAFSAYYSFCYVNETAKEHVKKYPHYYSTIMFTPYGKPKSLLLKNLTNSNIVKYFFSLTSDSVNLPSSLNYYIKMGDLIKPLIENKILESNQLRKLKIPFDVEVEHLGFDNFVETNYYKWTLYHNKTDNQETSITVTNQQVLPSNFSSKVTDQQTLPLNSSSTITNQQALPSNSSSTNRLENLSVFNQQLKGNKNYGVYKFSNIEYCRESINGNGGNRLSDFTQNGQKINSLKSSYFKVFDELNGGAVSRCTKSSNNKLTFEPYKCYGKRKLIVVALGNKLDRYNTQIKQAIANIFQANMRDRKALTLVTIKTGRIVSEPLLQCEDLNDMTRSEAKQIIYKKIKLRFGAYDLRTLEDLKLVSYAYQNQLDQLDRIFYLTDGANMPSDSGNIYEYATTPNKVWKQDNEIQLTVLTNGDCKVWNQNVMATCKKFQAGTIEKALQQFLKGEI